MKDHEILSKASDIADDARRIAGKFYANDSKLTDAVERSFLWAQSKLNLLVELSDKAGRPEDVTLSLKRTEEKLRQRHVKAKNGTVNDDLTKRVIREAESYRS